MITTTIKNLRIPQRWKTDQQNITVLAGDVGGTKTNVALYQATANGLQLLQSGRYHSSDYASCIDIIKQFLTEHNLGTPSRICFGVAGPVLKGVVDLTNLNWVLDIKEVSAATGVANVSLINDLEATAYGLAMLTDDDFVTLQQGDDAAIGNAAILAPGTGLGEAGLYWSGEYHFPFPTEGGHTDFAPRTDEDIELLKFLQKEYGVVSWEKVVAGPAITDIYRFLRDVKKREVPAWLQQELQQQEPDSAVISTAAIEQKAAICEETMALFTRYLAREASNLVLKMKATSGLFLGGGIPPKIAPLIIKKEFLTNYMDCDRMQHLLEQVPIRLIKNDKSGLMGAAYFGAYLM